MSKERLQELKEEVSKLGHNLGPPLIEIEEDLREESRKLLSPESEAEKFAVLIDMMGSHVRGERLLPETTTAYVTIGLIIVVGYTGLSLSVAPVATVAGDLAVLGLIYATLRSEIDEYIRWRRQSEPGYAVGQEAG